MGELCIGGFSEVEDGSGYVFDGFGEAGEIGGSGFSGGAATGFSVIFQALGLGL